MPEEAVAKIEKFNALAPVGNVGNLKSLLERNAESLSVLLPKHLTPERMVKLMLVAANRTPEILQCTQASVIETIQRAGELGLDISGTLGEAYPVPFGNKLQLIVGYRGLAKLARQSGMVVRIEAEAVYEKDTFIYRKGSHFDISFEPSLADDRGELRGFYAYAKLLDGSEQSEWMTVTEVEKVRNKAKSKDSPAWRDNFGEMGRKTVFRRLAKWLPLSSEKWEKALAQDDQDYEEPTIEVEPQGTKTERLVAKLKPAPKAVSVDEVNEEFDRIGKRMEVAGLAGPEPETGIGANIPAEAWAEVVSLKDGRRAGAGLEHWVEIFKAAKTQGWTETEVEDLIEQKVGGINTAQAARVVAIFGSFEPAR